MGNQTVDAREVKTQHPSKTKPLSNVKAVTQKQRMQKIHRGAE